MEVKVRIKDSKSDWVEKLEVSSMESAEQEIKDVISRFNSTLKVGELEREFIELVPSEWANTLEGILKNCSDSPKLPDIIDSSYGVGVIFDNKSGKFKAVADEGDRRIYLNITSFRGVSPGAIHYYGRLTFYGLSFEVLESKDESHKIGDICNISGAFEKPDEIKGHDIRLSRLITSEELKDQDRWKHYHLGDYTTCLDTKDDALELGHEVFNTRFTGNWNLRIDD